MNFTINKYFWIALDWVVTGILLCFYIYSLQVAAQHSRQILIYQLKSTIDVCQHQSSCEPYKLKKTEGLYSFLKK